MIIDESELSDYVQPPNDYLNTHFPVDPPSLYTNESLFAEFKGWDSNLHWHSYPGSSLYTVLYLSSTYLVSSGRPINYIV